MATLVIVAVCVLILNLPFGFWRAHTRRFSLSWWMSVHLPIPFVAAMRLASGVGWRLWTFPLIMAAYVAGQYLGGRLGRRRQAAAS